MITKEKLIVALKIALVGYEKNVGNGYDREYEFILDEDFAQIADDLIDAVNEPEKPTDEEIKGKVIPTLDVLIEKVDNEIRKEQ